MPNKFWSDVNSFAKVIPGYAKVEGMVDEHLRAHVQPIRGSIFDEEMVMTSNTYQLPLTFEQIVILVQQLKDEKIS
ncbi:MULTISPECIES: hypothetical protein [unclassified Roseofilum]|uniref:hypothetical protein n=1 Tax=unclassified Roseofilum TaxID=2620099 RepID=UPI001B24056C|nr:MULTISPECIES: hypothetical protein [unclassified Roseofilum]MBP0009852.1 hypothetical protein [Roseofilum sp. Belize Diploria]MBP0013815.1 hypothetical protein [Roseofilum sp. SID3]MBP0025078.1 hypothetical protein [Roseofilum sp. SID2]MBP0034296.1 hypothetical protein [Roseofilum sp. Belize BBD 4]MBP0037746.1 hypothetical protein [Roseofilum sp. SID1]